MSGRVGCGEGGWAISPERNYFCLKNKKSVHFDAVFNRQKTWTVTRSLWDTDFAVQLRNKAYRNSAKISKNHGQIRRGGGGRTTDRSVTVVESQASLDQIHGVLKSKAREFIIARQHTDARY